MKKREHRKAELPKLMGKEVYDCPVGGEGPDSTLNLYYYLVERSIA